MSEQSGAKPTLTRRTFLKTTGIVAGAAAVAGGTGALTALAEDARGSLAEEEVFHVFCPINCAVQMCGMRAHVRNGVLYKISAKTGIKTPEGIDYEYDRRPCLRGRSHVQWIYHPDRVKYPMRRVGERGSGEWERISWDEAIGEISSQLSDLRREYGPRCVVMPSMTGNYGAVQGLNGVFTRFANAAEVTRLEYCLDWGYAVGEARVSGKIYFAKNSFYSLVKSKTLFLWGNNITEAGVQSAHWIQRAKEGGTTVVCVDPRYSISASKASIHVPLKPGTDSAFALGMLAYVIERKLYDETFMKANTVATYLVREDTGSFLRMSDLGVEPKMEGEKKVDPVVVWDLSAEAGVSEGECSNPAIEGAFEVQGYRVSTAFELLKQQMSAYSSEWAAGLTGLDQSLIEDLACRYAEGPTSVCVGYGFDRYDNADIVGHTIATLSAITGNLGIPGGGFGSAYSVHGSMISAALAYMAPDKEHKQNEIPWLCFPDIVLTGEYKGEAYPVKALINVMSNAFSNQTQQKELLEDILPKIDLIVTHDSWMTDTARYSDYVLPAAHYFEMDDVGFMNWIQINEKAIDPLYEAKSNIDFFSLLAEGLGLGDYFKQTPEEVIKETIDTNKVLAGVGITYDRLKEEKSILNIAEDFYPGLPTNDQTWKTASGKLEFYQEDPKPRMDYGQTFDKAAYRLPSYSHPAEAYEGNPLREQYPLLMYTEHTRWRVHGRRDYSVASGARPGTDVQDESRRCELSGRRER